MEMDDGVPVKKGGNMVIYLELVLSLFPVWIAHSMASIAESIVNKLQNKVEIHRVVEQWRNEL